MVAITNVYDFIVTSQHSRSERYNDEFSNLIHFYVRGLILMGERVLFTFEYMNKVVEIMIISNIYTC